MVNIGADRDMFAAIFRRHFCSPTALQRVPYSILWLSHERALYRVVWEPHAIATGPRRAFVIAVSLYSPKRQKLLDVAQNAVEFIQAVIREHQLSPTVRAVLYRHRGTEALRQVIL